MTLLTLLTTVAVVLTLIGGVASALTFIALLLFVSRSSPTPSIATTLFVASAGCLIVGSTLISGIGIAAVIRSL